MKRLDTGLKMAGVWTLACLGCAAMVAQEMKPAQNLNDLSVLVGNWKTDAAKGQNKGEFTFEKQLNNTLLVRRDRTEYAATATRPAAVHDVLMMVYKDPAKGLRSTYFDSEGNHAEFQVLVSGDGSAVQFVSEAGADHPGLRLTYTRMPAETLAVKFEMGPPGSGAFSTVAEGVAHH